MMREYVENARLRVATAEQTYKAAADEWQEANRDFNVWNNAYTLAVKDQEKWKASASNFSYR